MKSKSIFNDKLKDIIHGFCFVAFAQESGGSDEGISDEIIDGASKDTDGGLNYEQLIANARKEEKSKLYPTIKKLREDLAAQVKTTNDLLLKNAALQEELEKLKNVPDKNEETYKTQIAELQKKIEELESNSPKEDEIRQRLEKEYEVKLYAQEQKDANKDKILGMLLENITGETKEDIDKAIQAAIEKTSAVKKELGIKEDSSADEDEENKNKPSKKKKQSERPPKTNPSSNDGGDEVTLEYVQGLDPMSEEYKEFRKKLGFKN